MELPVGRKLTVEIVVRGVEYAVALPDTAGYPSVEDLAALVERAVEEAVGRLEPSKEVMNAKEAADFLSWNRSQFNHLAASGHILRHRLSENRFVYLRSELLEWLVGR